MFSGNVSELTAKEIEEVFKGVPNFSKEEDTLINIITGCNIASSRREAREFINNGAISVNGNVIKDENYLVDKNCAIEGKYIVIRRGKKKYSLITLI